jgi:hypothetical protein
MWLLRGKKVKGRKGHIVTEMFGLMVGLHPAADIRDRNDSQAFLSVLLLAASLLAEVSYQGPNSKPD